MTMTFVVILIALHSGDVHHATFLMVTLLAIDVRTMILMENVLVILMASETCLYSKQIPVILRRRRTKQMQMQKRMEKAPTNAAEEFVAAALFFFELPAQWFWLTTKRIQHHWFQYLPPTVEVN